MTPTWPSRTMASAFPGRFPVRSLPRQLGRLSELAGPPRGYRRGNQTSRTSCRPIRRKCCSGILPTSAAVAPVLCFLPPLPERSFRCVRMSRLPPLATSCRRILDGRRPTLAPARLHHWPSASTRKSADEAFFLLVHCQDDFSLARF